MNQHAILSKILESEALPTLPPIASKLVEITAQADVNIQDIADLISKDISMSAKVLKIANSAFYSFPNQIGTINQAVAILGINAVRSLALSFTFLSIAPVGSGDPFDYKKFWDKSLAAGVAARLMAQRTGEEDPEEFFSAGLLQNIGELILARVFPGEYGTICTKMNSEKKPLYEVEQESLGIAHPTVGYEVAKSWQFPAILIDPIRYHHEPGAYVAPGPRQKQVVTITHLAGFLSEVIYSDQPQAYHDRFQEGARAMLGLEDRDIDAILETLHSELKEIASFFSLKIEEPRSIEEILMEANAALSVLNMSYEQKNKELIQAKVKLQKLTRELEEKNRRLETLASMDGLTEVYNHRYFQDFLSQEIKRTHRSESSVSLVLADVDHFKAFNDNYGHQTGDAILKQLCQCLAKNLREYDLLARYGGEEFVVVLPDTTMEGAMLVAEKLRQAVATQAFESNGDSFSVTMSFGVADLNSPKDNFKKDDLISFADKALFESKKGGRNRVSRYEAKKSWFGSNWGMG